MFSRLLATLLAATLAAIFLVGCRNRSAPVVSAVLASSTRTAYTPAQATGWVSADQYVGPMPRRPPQLRPGQQFLCMPDAYSSLAQFRDQATGQPISALKLGLCILTLRRINDTPGNPRLLEFSVEGKQSSVTLSSNAQVDSLPGLLPIIEDDTVDRLRHRYEGRLVWRYGSRQTEPMTDSAAYSVDVETPLLKPMQIRRIVRVDRQGVAMAIGGNVQLFEDTQRQYRFTDARPLVVILDSPYATYSLFLGAVYDESSLAVSPGPLQPMPILGPAPKPLPPLPRNSTPAQRKALVYAFAVEGDKVMNNMQNSEQALEAKQRKAAPKSLKTHVVGEFLVLADTWDFERNFSLKSPQELHPEWSRRVLKEIANRPVRIGMTRDMVAWSIGYGNSPGTVREIRAMPSWTYDDLRPWFYTVTFDKHSRVSSIDDPQLP